MMISNLEKKNIMEEASSTDIKKDRHAQQRKLSQSKIDNDLQNHSKPASRSDAVKDHSTSILKPLKPSMKKSSGALNLTRATCSSMFKAIRKKDSLNPEEQDGGMKPKLCTYTYCSLHGQKREEQLPAKAQKGMNQKLTKKYGRNKIEVVDGTLKVSIRGGKKEDGAQIVDIVHEINEINLGDDDEVNQQQEIYSVTSFEDYLDENSEVSKEDELTPLEISLAISSGSGDEDEIDHESKQSTVYNHTNEEESDAPNALCCNPLEHEKIHESQLDMKMNLYGSFIFENPLEETTNMPPKAKHNTTRKIKTENQENSREFYPRLPRFLSLIPEPQSEVVNLKHQDMEKRKTGEEWMIDYALRNTIRRMAPARKRKVAFLVAAFESVIQQEKHST